MELIATLNKPCEQKDKTDFIVLYNNQQGCEIKETDYSIEAWQFTDEEKAEIREAGFKTQFFYIENFGWYRKVPKGYSSAVESLNTAFNAVSVLNKLPAGMLIFYETPDFTKPEECTEEWLIEHQIKNQEMTAQEFAQFYMLFMTAWNTQMHENTESEEE